MIVSRLLITLAGMMVWFSLSSAAFAKTEIEWELKNPFRLFQKADMTGFHRRLYEQLESQEKQSPILSVERRLTQHLPFGWAEGLLERTCWSRTSGQHNNCKGRARDYFHPKSHKVLVWLQGFEAVDFGQAGLCQWRLKQVRGKKRTLKTLKKNCDERVEFSIPYPRGGVIDVRLPSGKVMQQTIKVKDIFIVGVGDSFGSGEGNPDVPVRFSRERFTIYGNGKNGVLFNTGYPARDGKWAKLGDKNFMKRGAKWMGQSCHRSLYSHQLRAALQLALQNPKRAITFAGYACAGAEITHGLFLRFKGNEWSPTRPQYSQISAVARAQCAGRRANPTRYSRAYSLEGEIEELNDITLLRCPRRYARKIDLLLVSIGGNDVGFSRLVANVVINDQIKLKRLGGWMGHVLTASKAKQNIEQLYLRYKVLRRAIHNVLGVSWSQPDRVIFTAYPNMAFRDKGSRVCDDGPLGMTVAPEFSLSSLKAQRAEEFANKLNEAMRKVSKKYKWSYVEGHRDAFTSHGICAVNNEKADSLAENLAFPTFTDGKWVPYNPADYAPYVKRERWFRTPNDAYLTGHLHLSGPVIRNIFKIKSLNRLQVLIAGTYSGAFHPTAEGQAVIADAVAQKAERVLAKYGQ